MKNIVKKIDIPLLIASLIMFAFGLIMIFSASNVASKLQYSQPEYYFAKRQLLVYLFGFIASIVILIVPLKTYKYTSKLLLIGAIFVLIMLKSYGIATNSAKSWII